MLSILKKYEPKQIIVFSNYKNNIPRITQFLNDNGYPALGISSLMTQAQRNRVIESFKGENKHNIMVATDVAARGLDIKGVDLVINYELPEDAENYVHRIGRTGRAEQKGKAFSFVSDKDVEALGRIEDYLKEKLEAVWLEDSELVADFKPMPQEEFRRFNGSAAPSGRGGDPDAAVVPDRAMPVAAAAEEAAVVEAVRALKDAGVSRADGIGIGIEIAIATEIARAEQSVLRKAPALLKVSIVIVERDVTGKDNRPERSTTAAPGTGGGRSNNRRNRNSRSRSAQPHKRSSTPTAKSAAAKGSLWSKITTSVKKMIGKK